LLLKKQKIENRKKKRVGGATVKLKKNCKKFRVFCNCNFS
jgi:hypothetical protein